MTQHTDPDEFAFSNPDIFQTGQYGDVKSTDLGMTQGRYMVVDPEKGPIGRGAQGVVYKGFDVVSGCYVAIKVKERKIRNMLTFQERSKEHVVHGEFCDEGSHKHIVEFLFANEGSLTMPKHRRYWLLTQGM